MVIGDSSYLKGRGFESLHSKLDGHFDIFYIDLLSKLFCLFEKNRK